MKLKFNMVVAALALVSAGAANADLSSMATGDSSLIFVGYDRTGASVGSYVADLGFNFLNFLPTSSVNNVGSTVQWNFLNNSVSVNGGPASTTGNSWSGDYTSFLAAIQSPELRWAVVAGQTVDQIYVTTGTPTAANVSTVSATGRLTNTIASNMGLMDDVLTTNRQFGTHQTAANGANFASAGTAYDTTIARFGSAGNWNSSLTWNATAGDNLSTRFQQVDLANPRFSGSTALPAITQFGNPNGVAPSLATVAGSFSFSSSTGTLTWAAAPVPEPSGYALALAGLGMLGFMARRRKV
jgi:MYXO-CTERM domain-containing protein